MRLFLLTRKIAFGAEKGALLTQGRWAPSGTSVSGWWAALMCVVKCSVCESSRDVLLFSHRKQLRAVHLFT